MSDITPRPPELSESAAEPMPALAEQIVELSTLTGGLAHEIRNPLSTLKVNLQLLDEDWRGVESSDGDAADVARRSRKRIATLLDEADQLERILQDFLQYVGKRELKREPHDLNEVVQDVADFFRPQTEAHGIGFQLHLADEPLRCSVDADVMKQAILNLLINAQQALPDGGEVVLRVDIQSEDTARIDVIDTGPGISADRQEHIFLAYSSTKKGGTGLGLATTRRLVREHGGRIHVHSEPPNGSCFTILLPRLR